MYLLIYGTQAALYYQHDAQLASINEEFTLELAADWIGMVFRLANISGENIIVCTPQLEDISYYNRETNKRYYDWPDYMPDLESMEIHQ